ncbi:MAG: hypothetical protein AAGA30_17200 [Planctomycetota bacterium]
MTTIANLSRIGDEQIVAVVILRLIHALLTNDAPILAIWNFSDFSLTPGVEYLIKGD